MKYFRNLYLSVVIFIALFSSVSLATPPVGLPDMDPYLINAGLVFPAGYQTTKEGEFKVVAYLEAKKDIKNVSFSITASKNLEMDVSPPRYSGGMLKGQKFHMKISGHMNNAEDLFESLHLRVIYGKEPRARRMTRTLSIQAETPSLIPPEGLKPGGSLNETTFTDWMMFSFADKTSLLNEAFEKMHIKVKPETEKLIPQLIQIYAHCDVTCKSVNIAEILANLDYEHILQQ